MSELQTLKYKVQGQDAGEVLTEQRERPRQLSFGLIP